MMEGAQQQQLAQGWLKIYRIDFIKLIAIALERAQPKFWL
jgi:hypothetical protein